MPCYHPQNGWRTPTNKLVYGGTPRPGWDYVPMDCGTCRGCRTKKAQGWTLRCLLEYQRHTTSVFTTLTVDEARNDGSLSKEAYSLFIKRLRERIRSKTAQSIRHFGCGEYGETTYRPHYHAILFGMWDDNDFIEAAWGHGLTHTVPANRKMIAYTAGYVNKKLDHPYLGPDEIEPPFLNMSRRPGIGAHAKIHWKNWRDYAIDNGTKMPVPRYLHEEWKNQSSFKENDALQEVRKQYFALKSPVDRRAAELIAEAKHNLHKEQRTL